MPLPPLYPLLLERRLLHRIWGGRRISDWLGLEDTPADLIGESWQVFDTNRVRNGPLVGHTLAEVAQQAGAALVGTRSQARYGADFPLLVKFLDAANRLSIQVHPDDTYAHAHEMHTGFHGKTEAWYILEAAADATIVHGLSQVCSRDEFAAAARQGTIETLLRTVPVQAGDTVLVPAGTVHAINTGILLYEIQEKSDLTYRVYDYGRIDASTGQPRALHLDKALDVVAFDQHTAESPLHTPRPLDEQRTLLVACPFFVLEHWQICERYDRTTDPASVEILTIIAGNGSLTWPDGMLTLRVGESVVVPASQGTYRLHAGTEPLTILAAYVPHAS